MTGGWVLHHATNAFAYTAPCAVQAGYWPMGGAWLVRHCFEHYQYTGDKVFLEETAYPLMKAAAQFLIDFLIEVPAGLPGEGMLTTSPSHSPENRYINGDGQEVYFTYGASMDYEIIRDLFGICSKTIAILRSSKDREGFEAAFEQEMKRVLSRIPDTRISEKTGCIMEWIEDYPEAEPGHRHMSHLYGIYPARRITLEKQPELAQAAIRTLDQNMANHYDGQGWSFGWMACLRAVLLQGEESYQALSAILREHMQYNLFVDAHGVLQVGDMQAVPMAVLEMLVQLREDQLVLLPALPAAWANGSVKGLHVKGGCILNMTWKNGRLTDVQVDESHKFRDYPIVDRDGRPWTEVVA